MNDTSPAPRPTLRQLEYLVTVADERHFGAAADLCRVSQPALSAQVKALETCLGVQLLERTSRSVRVTEIGEEVVARARAVLREVDDLVEVTRGTDAPLVGPLRVGVIPTIAPYLLPRVLPAVRQRHPDLRPHLREDLTEELLEALRAGRLDVVLLALPIPRRGPATRAAGLEVEELFAEPFVLASPPDHPLAGRSPLRQRDLADVEVLLLEDGHCLREHALQACHLSTSQEARAFRATSLTTLTQMVASGAGATLLPLLAADHAGEGVVVTRFDEPAPVRRLGLVWRASSARAGEYRLLADAIRDAVADVDGIRG